MFGESLLDLFKLGIIPNVFKKDHCDRSVASFVIAIGRQEIYEFIGGNYSSAVYIGATNYVNDISIMANNPNVYEFNIALEMDLSGQAVADSVGLNVFSGVGVQVDFLRWGSLVKMVNLLFTLLCRVSACIPAISLFS